MTADEAFAIVAAACSRMIGTLDDHQRAQAALKELNDRLNADADKGKPSNDH